MQLNSYKSIVSQRQEQVGITTTVWVNEPLAVGSPLYIERPPLETQAYNAILQPGCLLRLKAPRHMGKSSLLLRLDALAQQQGLATSMVNFLQADLEHFSSLDHLLRWFCRTLVSQLEPCPDLPDLDNYWDQEIGSKLSCTIYLEHALLRASDRPIVLLLNDVSRLSAYPRVAADFFALLRSWYEQARRSPHWGKLRLVMAYTSNTQVPLEFAQSPFNVGLHLNLPEFTRDQIQDLAHRDQQQVEDISGVKFTWDSHPHWVTALHDQVGGHPYLVHLAINHLLRYPHCQVDDIVAIANHPRGIFADHLEFYRQIVATRPMLMAAVKDLLEHPLGVQLPTSVAYRLTSLGLVAMDGDQCCFASKLYRRYFQVEFNHLGQSTTAQLQYLEQENHQLRSLAMTDGLTQISNRRAFDQRLMADWQTMQRYASSLTVILADIDHFKQYNDTYGHPLGDECLQLVAYILRQNVREPMDFVARYGGEEFVIIMPQASQTDVWHRAEQLRSQVKRLTAEATIPGVTLSLGLASVIPNPALTPEQLLQAADQALYQAKQQGRDRVCCSTDLV